MAAMSRVRKSSTTKEVAAADTNDVRFDVPLYTLAEAARVLDVPPSTIATWAKGYVRRPPGRRVVRARPVITAIDAPAGQPAVPFVGLAESMILAAVRRSGVPLQRIRPAIATLKKDIGLQHALASKALYTDGAELLFDYAQHAMSESAAAALELVVVRSGQRVFTDIVQSYLKRITYGRDGYARMLWLPAYERAEVLADPTRSFGQPIFAHGGVRVSDVLERFWAGDDIETLSEEFGVPVADIEDVLRAASRSAA
jgi:uncharacterized protein (DUF433 family)